MLYVGKARDLRARLRSYFRSDRQRPAVEAALGALERIEWRTLGSEFEAALEELRLIRELRPPANARSARPDRYVYLRRRGDTVVCSATPGVLGPIKSRRRAQLAARALQGVEWESLADAVPKLQEKLRRLAREQRFEDAARLRDRIEALEHVAAEVARLERLRELAVCVVAPGGDDGRRRGFFVAKGQVVCVRPFHGAQGVEWQAGLAAVARAEPSLAPESTDELLAIAGVPAAAAAGARGRVPTLHAMDELRERGTGDGWRKLVADGVTATPVTLRRGAAVKLVDGANTEIVARVDWPARLDALLAEARNVHVLSPDGDVHARRTKRGRWLVSHARPSSTTAVSDAHDREAQHPLPKGHPLFAATRISRDKERQVQHYVELLRSLPLWERDSIRVVDAGCGKAYMSLALVAYGREVGTRVELVGLDANPGVIETVRGIAERLGYDEARFEATTIEDYAGRRSGRPARLAARVRHRE